MDSEQAKLILSSWCPGGDATEDDELFAHALAQMEADPELAEWFAEQSAMDAGMRESLQFIEPPAHLRESILASAKVIPLPERSSPRLHPAWFAIAAGIVIAAGAFLLLPSSEHRLNVAQLDAEIPRLTAIHEHGFSSPQGNVDQVRAWLAANGGPADFSVPAGLAGRGAVSCEITTVADTKVTILCFHVAEGRTAHMYVVERSRLKDPPPLNTPVFQQQDQYAVASWSQGDHSYFLAERGDVEAVRQLL